MQIHTMSIMTSANQDEADAKVGPFFVALRAGVSME